MYTDKYMKGKNGIIFVVDGSVYGSHPLLATNLNLGA